MSIMNIIIKKTVLIFCAALLFAFIFSGKEAWAEDAYVRLAIKGSKVNLRPQPRAVGNVIAQVNTGDVFIAEKWPITVHGDKSDQSKWYKIVLAVNAKTNKISTLSEWDSRFELNVAFVRADYAVVSPLAKGEMEKISATPVGIGYSFNIDPQWGEFSVITEDNFKFFASTYYVKKNTDIYDKHPFNEKGAKVIDRYKTEERVLLTGRDSDGDVYTAMDPTFRRLPGFVKANSVKREGGESGEDRLNILAFNEFYKLYIGANIGEIVRKWGDFKINRSTLLLHDNQCYAIISSLEAKEIKISFLETFPDVKGPIDLTVYVQYCYIERKGAGIGGIYIGVDRCNKDWVKKLLGQPDAIKNEKDGESWSWDFEFHGVRVDFGKNGLVSAVELYSQIAD
jgi:hypothetical protein